MQINKEASLTESVYRAVRNDLVLSRVTPGTRLKTSALAQTYGVSLAAVREALTRLASEGLVEAEPQRGFRATALSAERLQDLTEVRIEIERMCICQSIARFNLLTDVRLDQAMEKLLTTATFDAEEHHVITDEWSYAHIEFHEILVSGCRNRVLMQMRRQLFDQSEPYRFMSTSLRHNRQDVENDHRPLVNAVHARDAERASHLITEHIRESTRMLLSTRFSADLPASDRRATV